MELMESLCIVKAKDDGSTLFLQRLADNVGGRIYQFQVDISREQNQENRNRLYYPRESNPMPLHGIAVYHWADEWNNDNQRWEQNPIRIVNGWIEAIPVASNSLEELLAQIQHGVDVSQSSFVDQHSILLFHKPYFENTSGLYLPYTAFTITNGRAYIKEEVTELKEIPIFPSDVTALPLLSGFDSTRYCYAMDPANIDGKTVRICSVYDDIRRVIRNRKKELFEEIGRTGAKSVNKFLTELPIPLLAEELAALRGCSIEDAKELLQGAFANGMDSLDADGIDGTLLQSLVEHNAELCRLLANLVEENWKRESKDLLEKAERQQKILRDEATSVQKELGTLRNQISSQRAVLSKLDEKIAARTTTLSSLNESLHSKIECARQDLGLLLTDYSFLIPREITTHNLRNVAIDAQAESAVTITVPCVSETARTLTTVSKLSEVISRNLKAAGVGKTSNAELLGAYLLGAFVRRTNITLCGFGGYDISCALSCACLGSNPAVLRVSESARMDEVATAINECKTSIVVIPEAFSRNLELYLWAAEHCKNHMLLFLTPFEESMRAEPKDIYRYALPICLSHFVSTQADDDYEFCIAPENLSIDRKQATVDEGFNACIQDSYVCTVISGICNWIQSNLPSVDADLACCFSGWIPLAICAGKSTQMDKFLKEQGLLGTI